jgi:hypothetical protein
MPDPVEEAEQGTVEDAAEATAAESEEIVDEAGADDEIADGADGQGEAVEDPSRSPDVKYSRFKRVHGRMKTAEEENIALKARLAVLEPKKPERQATAADRVKKILTRAPQDMPLLEQMEYYGVETLRNHPELLDEWFESRFGMKPEQAGATLSHATISTAQQIRNEFKQACEAHGLDPTNEGVQNAVGVLMDSKRYKTFEEAVSVFKPRTAVKQVAPRVGGNGKGAEVETVDLTGLSRVRALPKTKEEAMELAARGKRIEHASVVDILRASAEAN